jgi:DNA repair exonuclease SbcCD ATPase subunit
MKLCRLYISNFYCYSHAYIDFSEFSSALIVGKKENNDDISNGVGKTTIFKAIEYVLFNHADVNLENIIRDEAELCSVTIDFQVENQEYRLTRTRTCKGVTDITLFKQIIDGPELEALYSINNERYSPISNKKYWHDISGRRASDTEKELNKLLKINIKSFHLFVHFMQKDFSSLTAVTPEKRKAILRDALNLAIYPKMEKVAKAKFDNLVKELDKTNAILETLGDPDQNIVTISSKLDQAQSDLNIKTDQLSQLLSSQSNINTNLALLASKHYELESKFSSLLLKQQTLTKEQTIIDRSVKEYQTKKTNIVKLAKDLIAEIKILEETQSKLATTDFAQIELLSETIISNKEQNAQFNLTIRNDNARCEKLRKPIPPDGECEECRQPISKEHRSACQAKLNQELLQRQGNVKSCQADIAKLNAQNQTHQQTINLLKQSKQQLETVTQQIVGKKQEIVEKKSKHQEYQELFDRFTNELVDKNKELKQINEDLTLSSLSEAQLIKDQIVLEKQKFDIVTSKILSLNKEITQLTNNQAVLQYNLNQKSEQKLKKEEDLLKLKSLQDKLSVYPLVLQALSSSGIPNLIIQNVLDDLQIEANKLLEQLKPGIQLSFAVEKLTSKGEETDTLEINYLVNGKKRYFEQLSGGMQLAVTFSLKLGLSFLLQKMMGINIRFLLLDEVDATLDRNSVNIFSDIVRFFQKDFTILVITHKDWLKDKFSSNILVEQDIDLVSTAKVISL